MFEDLLCYATIKGIPDPDCNVLKAGSSFSGLLTFPYPEPLAFPLFREILIQALCLCLSRHWLLDHLSHVLPLSRLHRSSQSLTRHRLR